MPIWTDEDHLHFDVAFALSIELNVTLDLGCLSFILLLCSNTNLDKGKSSERNEFSIIQFIHHRDHGVPHTSSSFMIIIIHMPVGGGHRWA